MDIQHLSEQEIIRREKLVELRKLEIDPYPANLYPVNITAEIIRNSYKEEEKESDLKSVV